MKEILPAGGVVRKLWIGETAKYRDHLLRLDAQSRRNRFSGGVSDQFIRNYVALIPGLDTVVHGFFVGGTMRGAAELRPLGSGFPREAEAAFSVERQWQSHGVGSALLRRTLLTARNRGFRLLHMACLGENRRMQQLARKFDAELSVDFETVVGEVESSRPTPLSLIREMMSDSHGFATAMLDLQSRMLRASDSRSWRPSKAIARSVPSWVANRRRLGSCAPVPINRRTACGTAFRTSANARIKSSCPLVGMRLPTQRMVLLSALAESGRKSWESTPLYTTIV